MADKVETAIFGKDLKVQVKKYPLSANGDKIAIVTTGEGYFMPEIGPTQFLDLPSFKRFLIFGKRGYKRVYFARKKAAKCVDFGTDVGIVYGPDEEQKKRANLGLLAEKIGQDANRGTPWYIWAIMLMQFLILIVLFKFLGVY